MRWFRSLWLRIIPMTPAEAQKRVDAVDHALADLRAAVAALPADERAARAPDVHALIVEQAHVRNILSDTLDDRSKR
jgi:hypothetical protein